MAQPRGLTGGVAGRERMPQTLASVSFTVENLNCGGCVGKVERAMAASPGVAAARANLASRRLAVSFDPRRTTPIRLAQALEQAGFRAAPIASSDGDERSRAAERALLLRLGVAGFAAMNVMLLSVSVWSGFGEMDAPTRSLFHWIAALIALPTVAFAGVPFFASAWAGLRVLKLNMDVPISLGVILATGMSLHQTLNHAEHVYFDAAVSLLFFLLAGRYLDHRMRRRALNAAHNLLSLQARTAALMREDGSIERVASEALSPGMRILVASGERFASDGVVVNGRGEIDESLLSGETLPRSVGPGAQVYAGALNLGAPIEVEARAAGADTLLAEIARLMETAQQARGRYVRLADRAARLYAPLVHVLALATACGWLLSGQTLENALIAAIAVLIITCPCALALAVPAAQVAACSRLFGRGVLVKAADGLERLEEADAVVFDKTGVLTLGRPALRNADQIEPAALRRAASLAAASRHPYAVALTEAAAARFGPIPVAQGAREEPGFGMTCGQGDEEERLGSAAFCGAGGRESETASLFYARSGAAVAAFQFDDAPRHDAKAVVHALRRAGFHVELLSGDRSEAAREIALNVGIDAWRAGCKPHEKIARLEALKGEGRRVLMVGDGLNDAPALAAAHASLSPATAADIAQTASDAVFQGRSLSAVVELLATARRARRTSLQNFAIAAGYNALFIPLAVLGYATPLIAAVAMSTSSILVTANALRLVRARLELTR